MTSTDDFQVQPATAETTAESTTTPMPNETSAETNPSVPPRTSSLSPTPNTTVSTPASNEPTYAEEPLDPQVVALQAMFPDFDALVLQSVLDSVGGDQDKAIDILLGMSDPSYTSTANLRHDATQTELDEQFARTLLLEESGQEPSSWRPNDSAQNVPYRPRTDGPHHRPLPDRQGEGDSMAQIGEQLGKFAETGKRTFSTFLSKVKAKIQEFDSPSGSQSQPQGHHPLPHGDAWSTPNQSQTYYQPNSPPTRGYEVNAPAPVLNPAVAVPVESPTAGAASATPAAAASTTTTATAANTVDPAKIGLLPKRPISLGSSHQPSKTGEEEDDIEYVENPFDEPSRH